MKTILVADDEPGIVEALAHILADEGWSVRTAVDGPEVLALLRVGPPPDVVVCDVMMPSLDGYGVARAMRRDETLARVPLILMSAGVEGEPARAAGADFFLRKPFTIAQLLVAIDEVLSSLGDRPRGS